jgi:hypothetical protein
MMLPGAVGGNARVASKARRVVLSCALAALGAAGCADTGPRVETATIGGAKVDPEPAYPEPESAWPKLHSSRFHMSVPVPDGRGWVVDDHSRPELVATHAPTHSRLVVFLENEPSLVNRQRCEARARELGLVPGGTLRTVEDAVTIGPDAYDTRVWVALEPSKNEGGPITGHLFAFGAYVRRCMIVHLTSVVGSGRDEAVLSQRLALARVRLLQGITFDNFQDVPREQEAPARAR